MAKTEEGKLQDKSIAYANKSGIRHIRLYFGPGIQTGWPDVIFLVPGGFPIFIEFKAPGKVPTKKQEIKLGYLEDLEYAVFVIDDFNDFKKIIDAALEDLEE